MILVQFFYLPPFYISDFYFNHWLLWSLLNFYPQCSLPKACMTRFLHTNPQHSLAKPHCVSPAPLAPLISKILLVSQSCPSLSIWLSILTKLHTLTHHPSLLNVKVCPSSLCQHLLFLIFLFLLWRIASGNPTASLIESISNSFQVLSEHSFLKFIQEEFSKLPYLNALPQRNYETLLKSLQEKLYFRMKVWKLFK